jgi:hypothetical protein
LSQEAEQETEKAWHASVEEKRARLERERKAEAKAKRERAVGLYILGNGFENTEENRVLAMETAAAERIQGVFRAKNETVFGMYDKDGNIKRKNKAQDKINKADKAKAKAEQEAKEVLPLIRPNLANPNYMPAVYHDWPQLIATDTLMSPVIYPNLPWCIHSRPQWSTN